ncbi:acetyltransferase [Flavobacteriaceae bacterium F89]|uniref:Acetyltransferase n=1 Tax=Cerina litoralis TaxID=2874477 RepID=A0AAE3JQA4_9FLAO|nr:acetyltransferase [Cerina litoralis]MCG2461896.1 acetyltransferase [Cerina litoralis]
MQNIVILGASGHGSVILDSIEKFGRYKVIGFLDSFKKRGAMQNGYQVLGSELDLPYLIDKFQIHGGVVAIGDNWTRKRVVERITKLVPSFNLIKVVHPSAVIGKDVRIGKGSVILPGVVINTNAIVGDFCIINTNSSLGHDGRMENYSSLASGVCTGGNFSLGEFSAVSLGVTVLENTSIGEHTVIGAGSLVLKDIGSFVMAYGSPARVVRPRLVGESYLTGGKQDKLIKVFRDEI